MSDTAASSPPADAPPRDAPLSSRTLVSYCCFRIPMSTNDWVLRQNSRQDIWLGVLKMTPGRQGLLVSVCKSMDLLAGFIVGKASDNLRTRWGRRKPFIAVAFPIGVVAFFFFCNAGLFGLGTTTSGFPCNELHVGGRNASCPELKACLNAAIAAGTLPPYSGTGAEVSIPQSVGDSVYFALLYFAYFFGANTATQVTYDALGCELSADYHERTKLFGCKAIFQFGGYLVYALLFVVLSAAFADDVVSLVLLLSIVSAVLSLAGYLLLLGGVREKLPPPPKPQTEESVPIVPSVQRMLANRPYLVYLAMKLPLTFFSLIPTNQLGYFIKHTMQLENSSATNANIMVEVILIGMGFSALTVKLAQRYGKSRVLSWALIVEGALYICCFAVPPAAYRDAPWLIYLVGLVAAAGTPLAFGLPDAILNDIIDYDQLRTRSRNEGMYTVLETNVQQWIEILSGVVPLLLLSSAGYKNLGGCTCGCGVSCERLAGMKYARWHCPASIGYSCSGEFGSVLLFAPEPEAVPCTAEPEGVRWVIHACIFLFPGVCGIVAGLVAARTPITAAVHAKLREQLTSDRPTRTDPLTGKDLPPPPTGGAALLGEHFSAWERTLARARGVGSLRCIVGGRLGVSSAALLALLVAMGVTGDENLISVGCIFLAFLVVLLPFDGARLRVLLSRDGTAAALGSGEDAGVAMVGRVAAPPDAPLGRA